METTHIQTHNQPNQPDTVFLYGFPNQGIAAAEQRSKCREAVRQAGGSGKDCHSSRLQVVEEVVFKASLPQDHSAR